MCVLPEVPVFDGGVVPSSAPITCTNCGQLLYLACGPDSPPPDVDRAVTRSEGRKNARFKPKPCFRCLRTFQPKGPRSTYCGRADCESVAQSRHPVAASHPSSSD